MTTSLSDAGIQFASGNLIDIKTAMPSTGSYTQGDVIVEKSVNGTLSGWKRLTTGSAHVLGTDWLYFSDGLTLGTAQNTTSGTSIDFTSIPSWAKRITLMLNGVSTNGISSPQIQIGAGSVETTGYSGFTWNNASGGVTMSTTGFSIASANASATLYGSLVFTLMGGNLWQVSSALTSAGTTIALITAGTKTTSGTLDRLRLTTVSGTDTFDAGSVNIMYE